jgi:hypothetical protein
MEDLPLLQAEVGAEPVQRHPARLLELLEIRTEMTAWQQFQRLRLGGLFVGTQSQVGDRDRVA